MELTVKQRNETRCELRRTVLKAVHFEVSEDNVVRVISVHMQHEKVRPVGQHAYITVAYSCVRATSQQMQHMAEAIPFLCLASPPLLFAERERVDINVHGLP